MKKYLLISFLLMCATFVQSQDLNSPVNFPTPNAANLGLYGSIPVNHFTGAPNINVPLYTINEGQIKIPLNLSYHIGALKLNSHPGWTGLGWTLSTGGAITRKVNGVEDEHGDTDLGKKGFYHNTSKLKINDWSSSGQLQEYTARSVFGPYYEVTADEFSFNFLGFSGRFYLNHHGEWVVESEQNVKVIFEPENGGFIAGEYLRESITIDEPQELDYYINEFTLVTEDGTKYKFGGINATEYSTGFRKPQQVVATTWNLSKITSPNGDEMVYEYEEDNLIVSLGRSYFYRSYFKKAFGKFHRCSGINGNLRLSPANGFLLFPVYLKKITSKNLLIEFEHSKSTEMRYSNLDLLQGNSNETVFFVYHRAASELQWQQLDEIKVSTTANPTIPITTFNLEYTNSPDTRLKLLSVEEISNQNTKSKLHIFDYNPNNMPKYCSDVVTDHWGFFNGVKTITNFESTFEWFKNNYHALREPDVTGLSYQAEALNKITYPTGGTTIFEYEPHTYKKVVKEQRDDEPFEFATNQPAGGLRIKKITSSANSSSPELTKEFLYVNGYAGQNAESLASSGILSGYSQYVWEGYSYVDLAGSTFVIDLFSSNGLLQLTQNPHGNHVGYSEVVELSNGNGYRKYTFTNYDEDIHDFPHRDMLPITNVDPRRSIYSPYTSKGLERGKVTSITDYSQNNLKLNESKFFYTASSDSFIRSIKTDYLNLCSDVQAGAQQFYGTAFKTFTYDYNLTKKIDKVYDRNGLNPVIKTTEISYNPQNLISEQTSWNSYGNEINTKTYYPDDIGSKSSLQGGTLSDKAYNAIELLKENGSNSRIGEVIQGVTVANGKKSIQRTNFKKWPNNLVLPEFIENSKDGSDLENRVRFWNYDSYGNILDFSKEAGSRIAYKWAYNDSYPVIKADNTDSNALDSAVTIALPAAYSNFDSMLKSLDNIQNSMSQQVIWSDFNTSLRAILPRALITTYTYEQLIGISSITDPRGYTVYYDYDDFNRLKEVKDAAGKLVSDYEYEYKKPISN